MSDWLACVLVRGVSWLLCRVPPAKAVWLGEQLGRLMYRAQPKRRRIGIQNLRAAFDGRITRPEADRMIRAYLRSLGAGIVELLRLPVIDRAYLDRFITIEGYERFERANASPQPLILLTGHYGNWELCSIVAALKGYPIMALARAQKTMPRLYRLLVSYRESKGCTIVHKGGAMRRMLAALAQRQLIGIVGDQLSRSGIYVEFLGRPALFATGPFAMAHKAGAQVLPAFIHRTGGPFHRIVIEPPIILPQRATEEEAVRYGLTAFATLLARHIEQDPAQWLWLHKKWKYTPARRVLVLSDGKVGHVKQSLAVVLALRESHPPATDASAGRHVSHQTVEIRYRHRLRRALTLLRSWLVPGGAGAGAWLRWALTPDSFRALSVRSADVVVSCGSSLAPVNALWAAQERAKSVVLMNPAPLPLSRFDLVIAPRHDRLPRRRNVVQVDGALAAHLGEEELSRAGRELQAHPRFSNGGTAQPGPRVAVFLGGDTAEYVMSASFTERLLGGVVEAVDAAGGELLITTSRRTPPAVEEMLMARFAGHPRCRLLLLASRDALNGTMEGMLGSCDAAVVTGESISMVSEARAGGRPVVVVEPPRRSAGRRATKHHRFLEHLAQDAAVAVAPLSEVAAAVQRALREPRPPASSGYPAPVREALQRLIN